jgi:hypothetical protein
VTRGGWQVESSQPEEVTAYLVGHQVLDPDVRPSSPPKCPLAPGLYVWAGAGGAVPGDGVAACEGCGGDRSVGRMLWQTGDSRRRPVRLQSFGECYLMCLYFVCTVFTTVGFGAHPQANDRSSCSSCCCRYHYY